MSEEEKKALDILLNEVADIVIGEYCTHCKICENEDMECRYIKAIDTTYNLAKKQQKEIEENQVLIEDIKDHRIVYIDTPEFEENFISKDKIREKIKELENFKNKNLIMYSHDFFGIERIIKVLEELLEE